MFGSLIGYFFFMNSSTLLSKQECVRTKPNPPNPEPTICPPRVSCDQVITAHNRDPCPPCGGNDISGQIVGAIIRITNRFIDSSEAFFLATVHPSEANANMLLYSRNSGLAQTQILKGIIKKNSCTYSNDNTKRKWYIDMGANQGYFGFVAASYGCNVVLIEPQEAHSRALKASIAMNAWPSKVISLQAALSGNEKQKVRLLISNTHDGFTQIIPANITSPEGLSLKGGLNYDLRVSHYTLDALPFGDILKIVGITPEDEILAVKIDTEEYERPIMTSTSFKAALATKQIKYIFAETIDEDLISNLSDQFQYDSRWFTEDYSSELTEYPTLYKNRTKNEDVVLSYISINTDRI